MTLEYPVILKRLAKYTEFSGGEELALALTPTSIVEEARERLVLTSEARDLLEARNEFTLGGVRDIRPRAEQAERGVTLQPTDLLRVRDTLRAARACDASSPAPRRAFPVWPTSPGASRR